MQGSAPNILDLQRGRYRRQYDGFLNGRRINAVSMIAEAWFWRLHAIADDFGNFMADPLHLRNTAAPRRTLTPSESAALTQELVTESLIAPYEDRGEPYGHVVDFLVLQPPPGNGRRVRKYPAFPGEQSELDRAKWGIRGNPGESGGIRGLAAAGAGATAAEQSHEQEQDQEQQQQQQQERGAAPPEVKRAGLRSAAAAPLAARGEVAAVLSRLWANGTAQELADHPNATLERVCFLADRINREKPRRAQGFMRKGITEGWAVPQDWLERFYRAGGKVT